jgi:cbb3-type cytochrome oxidase subunit 3
MKKLLLSILFLAVISSVFSQSREEKKQLKEENTLNE